MRNFTIRAIFKIILEEDSADHFDEQIWLISGSGEREVYKLAMENGFREDEVFSNLNGQKVHWKFMGISEITAVEQSNISLISSRTVETDKNSLFENSILQRTGKLSDLYHHPIKIREFDH